MTGAVDPAWTADGVRDLLRAVIDPEAGINIVDLGLVYGVTVDDGRVEVEVTMTSPTCPMGDMILDEIGQVLAGALPAGWVRDVRLVWEPPWGPQKMSDRARAHFGWDGSE